MVIHPSGDAQAGQLNMNKEMESERPKPEPRGAASRNGANIKESVFEAEQKSVADVEPAGFFDIVRTSGSVRIAKTSLHYVLPPFRTAVPVGEPKGQGHDGDLVAGGRRERRPHPGGDPLLRAPGQRARQDRDRPLDVLLASSRMLQWN